MGNGLILNWKWYNEVFVGTMQPLCRRDWKALWTSLQSMFPDKKAEVTKAYWCEKGGKFLIEESQEPAKEALSCIKKICK